MFRGVGVLLALGMLLAGWMPGQAAPTKVPGVILVSPFAGHPGDSVYISGAGFPANRRLAVMLNCPGSAPATGAPVTNAKGQFVALRVTVPRLTASHGVRCIAAARIARVTGRFQLIPASQPLGHCATSMCIIVRATLVRLRSQTIAQIAITGWPGARAIVAVIRPNGTRIQQAIALNWKGAALVRMRVSLGLQKATRDYVVVTARLGRIAGAATAHFIVIPGGR